METVTVAAAAAITGAQNWAAVRAEYPDRVDAMAAGLMIGDAPADAVIAELFADRSCSWSDVVAVLDDPVRVAGSPRFLRDFLDSAAQTPEWYDAALARAGAHAWWRFGSLQSSTLYQSLIYGYQARGFIRPLVATGRLTEGTWDRVQATARWVTLATAPGMMEPGAPGWVETVRIRLVHALVRHHLRSGRARDDTGGENTAGENTAWDDTAWGVPINQTYAQLTITAGFLALPLRVAKDFGIRYSRAELEAITHMWRWIGAVMGVEDERLPVSYDDACLTHRIAHRFRLRPDEESKVLVRALLDDGYRTDLGLPGPLNGAIHVVSRPFMRAVLSAVSTRWVDSDTAAAMGLRSTPLHHVVDLARPVVRSREVVRTLGLLGSERTVAQRELRLVTSRLGIDLDNLEQVAERYRRADSGTLEPVA